MRTRDFPGAKNHDEVCANCGKTFSQSDFGALCDTIMGHRPVCSYECNVALGQVSGTGDAGAPHVP